MRFKYILFLSVLFFPLMAELNNTDFRFAHLTNNEGISQQHITSMTQDDKGMMWIGTKNGLCVYNGYEFKRYFNNSKNTASLNHNFIRSVFQDSRNRIWIGTEKGICRYQPRYDTFRRFDFPLSPAFAFAENRRGEIFCGAGSLLRFNEKLNVFEKIDVLPDSIQIFSLAIDNKDRLWVGTSLGLKVYDHKFLHATEFTGLSINQNNLNVADYVNAIFFDSHKNIWLGKNGNGIVRIDPRTNQISYWSKETGISDGLIRSISEDLQGRMWFGSEKGLSILYPNGQMRNIQQDFTNISGLNDNAIYSLLCDKDDNMWIGTYFGGVNIYKNDYKQFQYFRPGYASNQLKGKAVRKIVEGEKEILWIATEDGGLNRLNELTGEITKIVNPVLVDNIHALMLDSATHNLWIGMFRGGIACYNTARKTFRHYSMDDRVGLESDFIFSIEQDHDGVIWVATTAGLRYFNAKKERFEKIPHALLSDVFIYTLYVDSKNNVWIGTRTQGLFRYNKKSGEIKSWIGKEYVTGLADNFITAIFEDSRHRVWIGTNNGGLHILDSSNDVVSNVENESLQDEKCIYGILEDENHRLWISTNNGLICMDTDKSELQRYTIDEGLPVNQFNYASCLKSKNKKFYFGTVNGLISFYPEKIEKNTKKLNVVLLSLFLGNHKVTGQEPDSPLKNNLDATDRIKLTFAQARSFSIEYAAISLGHTSNITYAVKMEGVDHEWNYVGNQRRIVYSGLPHGDYKFRVKASYSNQNWNLAQERVLEIEILPPFYLSNLAFLIYFILFGGISFTVFRFISIRMKEKNLMRIEHLEKENIKAMNKLKIDFFTNISHELKTPLTLILSPLQNIVEDSALLPGFKSRLQTVLRNAHRMVRLIEELVTFNKIESGQTLIHVQRGNPLGFIEEIYFMFKDIAVKKEIHFELNLENNGEEVWYSLSFVEKIVNNLLSNAFKFTPEGGVVKLSASIIEKGKDELYLNIVVEDTGIGIAKEETANVFNNYYQTYRGQNFNPNGWGIGLALTQNLVRLHKGTINLESEVGKGSRFSVLLNVSEKIFADSDKSEIRADQNFLDRYSYQNSEILENTLLPIDLVSNPEVDVETKYTLLVVDDNKELASFLSEIFRSKYKVLVAFNGEEALSIALKVVPDLIISDIMMPVMDGITLCDKLKNNLLTSHIPVILLTAKQGHQNMITGYESGADMYVEKPFNVHALELMVQNLIRTRDQNRKTLKENPGINITTVIKNPRDERLLNDLKAYIEENIQNENLSVPDLTLALGISRTVLHVKMRSLMDMSISEYIRTLRLNRAKEYLQEGQNVSESAYNTGFSDPNYFSKCFKKQYGLTPTDFITGLRSGK